MASQGPLPGGIVMLMLGLLCPVYGSDIPLHVQAGQRRGLAAALLLERFELVLCLKELRSSAPPLTAFP